MARRPPDPDAPTEGDRGDAVADLTDTTTAVVELSDVLPLGHLRIVDGVPGLGNALFALQPGQNRIGRGADCEITLPNRSVSRLHATIVCEDSEMTLVHESRTNPTQLNGERTTTRQRLYPGDEIRLSGLVVLTLDGPRAQARSGSLRGLLEEQESVEQALRRFERDGAFADVDVVDSFGLKSAGSQTDVILSFERLREWIRELANRHSGRELNSNGDEVMLFFPDADSAVSGCMAILRELPRFNEEQSRLARPFRLRIGAHAGRAPVDFVGGYSYSPVLDTAGHLQKSAEPDGLCLSPHLLESLSFELPVSDGGVLAKSGQRLLHWRPPEPEQSD